MRTKEMKAEYRLEHWSRMLHERLESGLSVRAFCMKAGIQEKVYYYWQRKLRETVCAQTVEHRQPIPCFAEVRLKASPARSVLPEPESADRTAGRLCVELSGMRLTADGDYPPEKLALLLRGLGAC